jgi:sugar phosphate isomerase/epimerase
MVPGKTLTEQARNLKAWGFDAISISVDYTTWSSELREELSALETHTGISPCEFVFSGSLYGHLMDKDHAKAALARAMYRDTLRHCADLAMVTELEYEYGAQDPLPLFSPYKKMDPLSEKNFLSLYGDLASSVSGSGGYLLLENINRYESPFLNSVEDCVDILKKLNMPNTGLLMDFFHMSIEEADIPASIRMAGKWIRHIHLGDNNRLLPGQGNIDWEACFKALKEIAYSGYLNLECSAGANPEQTLPEAARFVRQFL